MISIEDMATFCKKKGFVYPSSEIYGGLAGIFDYGPYGSEMKKNIEKEWWKSHVQQRKEIVGIDGSIISHQKIWEASGHLSGFSDVLIECSKCGDKIRGDILIEDTIGISTEGLKVKEINKLIKENNIRCLKCKSRYKDPLDFNLMFPVSLGAKGSEDVAYLRGETAQLIFANFKNIVENARLKLPFGIAQMGKAFRNEIAPRNFLFRCREFEMMEVEYFIHPKQRERCPFLKEFNNHKIMIYSAEMQKKKQKAKEMKIRDALKKKIIRNEWHAYWLAFEHNWFKNLGVKAEKLRIRQHKKDELAHYSSDCWDLEYEFPFGWKELEGIADRADYDLKRHIEYSKEDLTLFDEESKQKIIPHVIAEPSLGVGRSFLVFMYEAYNDDKKRGNIVLKLHPKLAPVKIGVFPLVNKLGKESEKVFEELQKDFIAIYDKSGSIGRRYARADELGIPYCVTVDFDSKKKKDVTIRNRDNTKQIRVKVKDLKEVLGRLINNEIRFDKAGEKI